MISDKSGLNRSASKCFKKETYQTYKGFVKCLFWNSSRGGFLFSGPLQFFYLAVCLELLAGPFRIPKVLDFIDFFPFFPKSQNNCRKRHYRLKRHFNPSILPSQLQCFRPIADLREQARVRLPFRDDGKVNQSFQLWSDAVYLQPRRIQTPIYLESFGF